ncbi:hypothetical protein [Altererythrobacter lutimaris]|uniref:Uncharacterized protein n=1 Tax=Altererythrobacter lutimaris TaxID=2743979 RepID=A0A850H2K6_9SPHN|nr:hypothetical protein [Altererythrobacter lutimaris]NVE93377.1 hypothetical protein [Altererythrobacter lutimaris]
MTRAGYTISRAGDPTHRLRVPVYAGTQYEPDELLRYDGPPDRKFEPLDSEEREEWAKEHDTREDKRWCLDALLRGRGKYGFGDVVQGREKSHVGDQIITPVRRLMNELHPGQAS